MFHLFLTYFDRKIILKIFYRPKLCQLYYYEIYPHLCAV